MPENSLAGDDLDAVQFCSRRRSLLEARSECLRVIADGMGRVAVSMEAKAVAKKAKSQMVVASKGEYDTPDPSLSLLDAFPLSWSNYVRLMSVEVDFARWLYEESTHVDTPLQIEHYPKSRCDPILIDSIQRRPFR